MEALMRPPFYLDKMSPQERTAIKRWYAGGACVYGALVAIVVGMLAMKSEHVQSHIARLKASGDAVASERHGSPICAGRDLKLVMLIEELGEAKAVPGERLAEAFFTMMKARELCRTGRVAEALAIYDGIEITPGQSAAK
jgi:hypothetical protein